MQPLNPLSCPLKGRVLIEASAGTGKTFTIGLLFLRLLLERKLELEQLLVVTFTEAATEELRDRIRSRVREALLHLRREADTCADAGLAQLLAQIPNPAEAEQRLADALVRMDEAAIFTIHGFCARLLQDQTFLNGLPFEQEQLSDESALRQEIMQDFWRRQLAVLDLSQTTWLLRQWATPDALLREVSRLLPHAELSLVPDLTLAEADALWAQVVVDWQQLGEAWQKNAAEIRSLLESHKGLDRRSYNKRVVAKALEAGEALATASECPSQLEESLQRLTPILLSEKTKEGFDPPSHALFDHMANFMARHTQALTKRRAAWFGSAYRYLRQELIRRKTERQQLYFDDLLRLAAEGVSGAQSAALIQALQRRYPVALIDEFQDTDALQFRIFNRLYPREGAAVLFLIGDPKQAIYSFRGGDIFAYLKAREAVDEAQQFQLDTNWRASSGLVQAVNHLFGRDEVPRPFVLEKGLAFLPVNASDNADAKPLLIQGERPAPMAFWLMPGRDDEAKVMTKGTLETAAAMACAGRIAELLTLAEAGQVQLGDQPLVARDIAVLVRTHNEGRAIRQALREVGVASAALSPDSVFTSPEGAEMSLMLAALAEPVREGRLRAFLVSRLMGNTLGQMAELSADDLAWSTLQQRFYGYHDCWQRQGFMAAFIRLLQEEGIAARLIAQPEGERSLTNLWHLAELLHLAATRCPGIEALCRWFADQRRDEDNADEKALRLESDESLVRIVTIHASKGLEYPLVFLPFVWSGPSADRQPLFHHPDKGLCLDLGSDQQTAHGLQAWQEKLAEQLRLLYVAVTRAKHHCVLIWGDLKGAESTALAWLLHQSATAAEVAMPESLEGVRETLEHIASTSRESIQVDDCPAAEAVRYAGRQDAQRVFQAPKPLGPVAKGWRLTSYSALIEGAESERPDHDAQDNAPLERAPSGRDIFGFPRGATAGTFLHALLEQSDFADPQSWPIAEQLGRHGLEADWQPVLQALLENLVNTDLDGQGLCLAKIARGQRRDELQFQYPLAQLDVAGLQTRLSQIAAYRSTAEGLDFDPVRGLMRGAIDLVFQWQGRFYLADYKSSYLGPTVDHYGQASMQRAMEAHRYDLQYLIYTVALVRYLRLRLVDFDYERHIGGVFYLFLRGIRPGGREGIYIARPPRDLIETLDRWFAGEEEGA